MPEPILELLRTGQSDEGIVTFCISHQRYRLIGFKALLRRVFERTDGRWISQNGWEFRSKDYPSLNPPILYLRGEDALKDLRMMTLPQSEFQNLEEAVNEFCQICYFRGEDQPTPEQPDSPLELEVLENVDGKVYFRISKQKYRANKWNEFLRGNHLNPKWKSTNGWTILSDGAPEIIRSERYFYIRGWNEELDLQRLVVTLPEFAKIHQAVEELNRLLLKGKEVGVEEEFFSRKEGSLIKIGG